MSPPPEPAPGEPVVHRIPTHGRDPLGVRLAESLEYDAQVRASYTPPGFAWWRWPRTESPPAAPR